MGLFSKAVKDTKLKRLKNILKNANIDSKSAYNIQKTIKNEIKLGRLSINNIEDRLNFFIKQFDSNKPKKKPKKETKLHTPEQRTLKFLINQNHNISYCPQCSAIFLKSDSYCYKCGLNLEDLKLNEKNSTNEGSEKEVVNPDTNFKFAYVIFLSYLAENNSLIDENEISAYDVCLEELKNKALKDNYIREVNSLNEFNVVQLKNLLKNNELKVSGCKRDLIKRIKLHNIEFSDKIISKKGLEFVNNNKHIIFYYNHPLLKSVGSIDTYESIFQNKNKSNEKEIIDTVIEFLK